VIFSLNKPLASTEVVLPPIFTGNDQILNISAYQDGQNAVSNLPSTTFDSLPLHSGLFDYLQETLDMEDIDETTTNTNTTQHGSILTKRTLNKPVKVLSKRNRKLHPNLK